MTDRRVEQRRQSFGRRATDIHPFALRVWIRRVWIAYFALAVAMAGGFYIGVREHDSRIRDNRAAIAIIQSRGRAHALDDEREAAAAIKADCDRARNFRRIALRNGLFDTPQGRADLRAFVLHASRIGCTL